MRPLETPEETILETAMDSARVTSNSTRPVIHVLRDGVAVARLAADLVEERLRSGQLRVLGVATGSSPAPVYAELAARRIPGWEAVSAFALDEYARLDPAHPASYHRVVEQQVRAPLGLDPARVHVPDGSAADLTAAAAAYEAAIAAAGGVDLQLLGIGGNGHIGFNEPGSPLDSRTRVVDLDERTRTDNARFFDDPAQVPHRALTQGVATIGSARTHLLLATGAAKAEAVRAALEGPVGPECPASAVRLFAAVHVLLDEAAAALLSERTRTVRAA